MTICRRADERVLSGGGRELLAGDLEFTDNRHVISAPPGGRSAAIENVEAAFAIGSPRFEMSLIATRGERLVLLDARFRGRHDASAFESPFLELVEINDDDLVCAVALFDADDLDWAYGELDQWYFRSLDAGKLELMSLCGRYAAALRRRDVDAMTDVLAPDAIRRDFNSGPSMNEQRGSKEWVDNDRPMFDLVGPVTARIASIPRISAERAVAQVIETGETKDGSAVEWAYCTFACAEQGRITLFEYYDFNDVDRAVARFDELAGELLRPGGQRMFTSERRDAKALRAARLAGARSIDGGRARPPRPTKRSRDAP